MLMNCPECGGKVVTIDTKHDSDSIQRKKKCVSCQNIFFTSEIESSDKGRYFKYLSSQYRTKIYRESRIKK